MTKRKKQNKTGLHYHFGLPQWFSSEESACCVGDRRHGFNPSVRNITWRKKWQPAPVLLPGKSHE